jgi:hypothetical protein
MATGAKKPRGKGGKLKESKPETTKIRVNSFLLID